MSARHNNYTGIKVNTFMIGNSKCGTTSLFKMLENHPDIKASNIKEPIFFNTNEYAQGYEYYLEKYFDNWNKSKIMLDASTQNMLCKYVAKRIYNYNPNAKFIVCIRNPIERAYAQWIMHNYYRPGYTHKTFEEAITNNYINFNPDIFTLEYERMITFDGINESYRKTYIEQGLYYRNIQPYIELFNSNQIFFIDFEDIINNNQRMVKKLFNFLNIEYYSENNIGWFKKQDESNMPKFKLYPLQIWKHDSNKLSNLLGIDFIGKWYK